MGAALSRAPKRRHRAGQPSHILHLRNVGWYASVHTQRSVYECAFDEAATSVRRFSSRTFVPQSTLTAQVAGAAMPWRQCGKRALIAFVALVALPFPVYYVVESPPAFIRRQLPTVVDSPPAFIRRQLPTDLTRDCGLASSNASARAGSAADEAPETSNSTALQRVLDRASAMLSCGTSRDAVAYETVDALLLNGSSLLAQEDVQRAVSDSLHMPFADASRVHIIMKSYKEGYHNKHYERVAAPPDCSYGTLGVVVVPSLPVAVERREVIRKAWGDRLSQWRLRLVFAVGLTPDVAGQDLNGEHGLHKDLLVVEFVESYYNLSLKCLLAMRWVSERCSAASYMIKADDDVYIYPANLHRLLLSRKRGERKILGNVGNGFSPHRSMTSKWYVPLEIYDNIRYPTFVFGPCYMLAVDTLKDLIDSCKGFRYLYLEDVFITGICSHALSGSIQHEQVPDFLVNSCDNLNAVAVHHSKVPYRTC